MSTTTTQPKSPPSADDLTAVPRGYKRTEVGVIPEDWVVNKLNNLCFSIVDGTHYTPKYINEGIPFFSVENVTSDNFSNTKFISQKDHDELTKRCKPEKGDILLTRIGSLGKTKLIDWDVNASIYVSLALMKLNNRVLTDFLYRYSESSQFIADVEKRSLLNAIPMKINMGDIGDIPIPVPSFPEQRAIATVLNDMDALITSLDNLIVKKRLIKQGAMQQLLTGKKRLPGFSGEWEVMSLNALGKFRGGSGFPVKYQGEVEGDYPFFKVSDMNNEGNSLFMVNANNWITEGTRQAMNATSFPQHTIVFAKIGAAIFLERKRILAQESCLDNNMMGFILYPGVAYYRFVHYLFKTMQLGKLTATTALPSLNGKEIAALFYSIPPLPEQIVIADVLSDIDNEITALEEKLTKTRQIKQGMMQELLTGKTRLI